MLILLFLAMIRARIIPPRPSSRARADGLNRSLPHGMLVTESLPKHETRWARVPISHARESLAEKSVSLHL
jgi:hypothetical protein